MTDDEKYEQLDGWLHVIEEEVRELRINQHIFWEVQEIIRKNARVNIGSSFYEWMGSMYAAWMAVAIRRQVDSDRDSISALRMLEEVRASPHVLSRSRYKTHFNNPLHPAEYADRDFDRQVGVGRDFVDPSEVEKEIQKLKGITAPLRKYVNKRITHYDKALFMTFPTFQDVDDAVEYLEELLKRYLLLFRAVRIPSALPVWQYDWKEIFKYPWIQKETSPT